MIGDIHGCYDELVELLDKCNGRDPNLCVIFVGDLMNKGPKSVEVVRLVRGMGAYCVRGNHDEVSLREWQKYWEGGIPLSDDYQWLKSFSNDDLVWVSELPYTISIPSKNIIVVHAGLVPGVGLECQHLDDLLHMRDVLFAPLSSKWTGYKKPHVDSVPWASAWPGPEHVYFGHDARRFFQSYDHATGLDTGCVYGGKLTAVFPLEGGRTVQVKSHRIYHRKIPRNQVTQEEGKQ